MQRYFNTKEMKYKVNDNVKYDSGEWLFYGTVTAVIENSVTPCYRLRVDRMIKKNCKFSITQFEFELALDNGFEQDDSKLKWEHSESEYLKKYENAQHNAHLSKIEPEPVLTIPLSIPEPEPISEPLPEPKSVAEPELIPGKKQRRKRNLKQKKADTPQKTNEKIPNRKKRDSWDTNYELYRKGEKSNAIYTWMYQNRIQYKTGVLKEDRFEKLMGINFPFEVVKKVTAEKTKKVAKETIDIWHKQLRQWKNGDNRASLQSWRQKNLKRYSEGKLSTDKVEKLKEAGIIE